MNKTLKEFLHRGLMFGGFGPIIVAIIYLIIEKTAPEFSLGAFDIFLAIISTYLLAFVQAGATVFDQKEEWSVPKSMLVHFLIIYPAYIICYLLNNWIPFNINIILIFTVVFIIAYLIIWLSVLLVVRNVSKTLNAKL